MQHCGIDRGSGGLDDVAKAVAQATSGLGLRHADAREEARGWTVQRPIPSGWPPCRCHRIHWMLLLSSRRSSLLGFAAALDIGSPRRRGRGNSMARSLILPRAATRSVPCRLEAMISYNAASLSFGAWDHEPMSSSRETTRSPISTVARDFLHKR